jgi:hypothetical protein
MMMVIKRILVAGSYSFKELMAFSPILIEFFVGRVEPTPDFVGFRCTLPNLHFPVLLQNAKPNRSRFRSQATKVSFLIRLDARNQAVFNPELRTSAP